MGRQANWAAALRAMAELLGHEVAIGRRQGDQVEEYCAVCSCGFQGAWGTTKRGALRAGTRHLSAVADSLSPADRRRVALSVLDQTDYRAS